jgi:hypothetical protein
MSIYLGPYDMIWPNRFWQVLKQRLYMFLHSCCLSFAALSHIIRICPQQFGSPTVAEDMRSGPGHGNCRLKPITAEPIPNWLFPANLQHKQLSKLRESYPIRLKTSENLRVPAQWDLLGALLLSVSLCQHYKSMAFVLFFYKFCIPRT